MSLTDHFPHLAENGFRETSPATRRYNCIAWAAGSTDAWWWPDPMGVHHWPEGVAREETLEAFIRAFASLGYVRCDEGQLEAGWEKLAIYTQDGKPKHAARQQADASWTSKLGESVDICHALISLEGSIYGQVAIFLKRFRPSS